MVRSFPVAPAPLDGGGSGCPRVDDRHFPPRQALTEPGAGALRGREVRIGYDDEARLDGVEQRVAEGFVLHRQTGNHNVGAQVGRSFAARHPGRDAPNLKAAEPAGRR